MGFRYLVSNTSTTLNLAGKTKRVTEVEEEQVRGDEDESGQTDLCLAHVGQRLFEMLWRSRGMARGQLARISKHKSRGAVQHMKVDQVNTAKKKKNLLCFDKKTDSFEGLKPL